MTIRIKLQEKTKCYSIHDSIGELMDIVNKKVDNDINNLPNLNGISLGIEYNEHYTKKELVHICNYYKINVRKKNKDNLINELIIYELDAYNYDIVIKRQYLWNCMEELHLDPYLKKFIIGLN